MMIHKSRFAPSPTGNLHLGNARTALFSWLAVRKVGGAFVLRLEDTDQERSLGHYGDRVLEDLRWLGIDWDEGPDCGGPFAPYRQMERLSLYGEFFDRLQAAGNAYPCFCTAEDLEKERQMQLAAGRPPRYSGRCRELGNAGRSRFLEAGCRPTLRFAVPRSGNLRVQDLVWGERNFSLADTGDFVIRRSDGTPAFLFANAVDDALMGIDLVLRGEDHLSNTPRQILVLEALALPAPQYGHLPLLVAQDGQPLSKRHGAASLRDLRARGYLPAALCNYLGHLGHHYPDEEWREMAGLVQDFSLGGISRSPARFDWSQLHYWQSRAIREMDEGALQDWLSPHLTGVVPPALLTGFLRAIRENILLPPDAVEWAGRCFGFPFPEPEVQAALAAVGSAFWEAAEAAFVTCPEDFPGWTRKLAAVSGQRGRNLYLPLRLALTGVEHGPELAALVPLLGPQRVRERLHAAAAHSSNSPA